jgi:hypothetical protein
MRTPLLWRVPGACAAHAARRVLRPRLTRRQALFVSSSEDDDIVHRGGLLQRDVEPERVTETLYEQLDLLWFSDRWVAAGERHEPPGKLIHRSRTAQHGQFTQWCVRQWRPKTGVDQLDKLPPRWPAAIELQTVKP